MNCPLQSGHEPPQPWAEPVFVTSAPITRTTNMPHAVTTESHLRTRYIRACQPPGTTYPCCAAAGGEGNRPTLSSIPCCHRRGSTTRITRSGQRLGTGLPTSSSITSPRSGTQQCLDAVVPPPDEVCLLEAVEKAARFSIERTQRGRTHFGAPTELLDHYLPVAVELHVPTAKARALPPLKGRSRDPPVVVQAGRN